MYTIGDLTTLGTPLKADSQLNLPSTSLVKQAQGGPRGGNAQAASSVEIKKPSGLNLEKIKEHPALATAALGASLAAALSASSSDRVDPLMVGAGGVAGATIPFLLQYLAKAANPLGKGFLTEAVKSYPTEAAFGAALGALGVGPSKALVRYISGAGKLPESVIRQRAEPIIKELNTMALPKYQREVLADAINRSPTYSDTVFIQEDDFNKVNDALRKLGLNKANAKREVLVPSDSPDFKNIEASAQSAFSDIQGRRLRIAGTLNALQHSTVQSSPGAPTLITLDAGSPKRAQAVQQTLSSLFGINATIDPGNRNKVNMQLFRKDNLNIPTIRSILEDKYNKLARAEDRFNKALRIFNDPYKGKTVSYHNISPLLEAAGTVNDSTIKGIENLRRVDTSLYEKRFAIPKTEVRKVYERANAVQEFLEYAERHGLRKALRATEPGRGWGVVSDPLYGEQIRELLRERGLGPKRMEVAELARSRRPGKGVGIGGRIAGGVGGAILLPVIFAIINNLRDRNAQSAESAAP